MPTEMKNHKWMVLSNTTLGMLAATINASIVLISLPAIFRGIGLKPLDPGNTNILLWTIMGYMVVTSVLVVSFGRLGDMFGRAKIYNLGFLIFTLASVALSFMPTNDERGAVPGRDARRPGHRRRYADRDLHCDPHRRVPAASSAGWRSASTSWRRSPGSSSGWFSVACSPTSTGG